LPGEWAHASSPSQLGLKLQLSEKPTDAREGQEKIKEGQEGQKHVSVSHPTYSGKLFQAFASFRDSLELVPFSKVRLKTHFNIKGVHCA
jgi:hypothetical protein